MARHRIHHAPPSLRCPHCRGQARHLFYHSIYRTRDGPRRLWQCRLCQRCLSERRGTAFFNLKTPEAEVARALDAMLRGDTQTSTAHTRHHRRDTLRRWRRRAATGARAVDQDLVTDLEVTDLELDEQWSFAGCKKAELAGSSERGEAWWHKAMARESRLLVEQFVSPRTAEAAELLVNQSFDRLAARCLPRVSSDGYDAYTQALSEQVKSVTLYPLQWALMRGKRGRPPQPKIIPDPALVYGQVVKEREGRKVVKVKLPIWRMVLVLVDCGLRISELLPLASDCLEPAASSPGRSADSLGATGAIASLLLSHDSRPDRIHAARRG